MSDDYQSIPVAEARAAIQSSGLLEAFEGPQYLSPQSPDWRPYFAPSADVEHPDFARVVVTRQGQKPREVVIAWDEYAAELALDDPAWAEKREQKPMTIFGAEVERHGYRVVFADVLAPLIPAPRRSENDPPSAEAWAAADATPERDWRAEVGAATAQTLNALYDEARDAGALLKIGGLQQAFTDRLLALSSVPKPTPAQTPRPADAAPKRPRNRGRGKR